MYTESDWQLTSAICGASE